MKTLYLGILVVISITSAIPVSNVFAQYSSDEVSKKDGLIIAEVELDSANGSQWIKLYNPTDHLIHLGTMYVNSSDGIHYLQMATAENGLQPGQFQVLCLTVICDQSALPKSAVWTRIDDAITIYPYPPGINDTLPPPLWYKTPALSDTYNDSKTWQYDGVNWVFTDQKTVRVPEFTSAIPVFLASIASLLVFYRLKFS